MSNIILSRSPESAFSLSGYCLSMRIRTEILQRSRALEVLTNLCRKKEAGLVEIVDLCGGSTSVVNNQLLELKAAGLISEEREAKFGGRRLFRLTEDGEKVAKDLLLF